MILFSVIDAKTVLVFDELIVNNDWENDEYKALNEVRIEHKIMYKVRAVSLFTKQAVVTLENLC